MPDDKPQPTETLRRTAGDHHGITPGGTGSESVTEYGTILGTPGYMSPEQAKGQSAEADPSTDVYGLGAILYFLLTHQPPGNLQSLPDVPDSPIRDTFQPLHGLNPAVPKKLEAICMKALSHDPVLRYSTVPMLAQDIEHFLNGFAVSAYLETLVEKFGDWIHRNRFMVLLLLAYLLARILIYFFGRL